MAKDIIITPASGLVDFQGTVGVSSAVIQLDNDGNLNINSTSGDVNLGNTSSDVYVGDGVANVDIVFEQDGEIRGLTGKTVTLGQTDSYIKINAGLKDSNNQVGTASSVLLSTGSGIKWESSSLINAWSRKTANYTAVNGDRLIVDTSGGTFTITLPATPSTGHSVVIADGADWGTTNLTIARNGSTIEGTAQDLTVDIGTIQVEFIYDGTTWEVYTTITNTSGVSGFSPINYILS